MRKRANIEFERELFFSLSFFPPFLVFSVEAWVFEWGRRRVGDGAGTAGPTMAGKRGGGGDRGWWGPQRRRLRIGGEYVGLFSSSSASRK